MDVPETASALPAEEATSVELLRPGVEVNDAREDIWHILESVDNDFFPPLSTRPPFGIEEVSDTKLWGAPIVYFESVLKEHVIMVSVENKRVGLLSFLPHHRSERLVDFSPCGYISTLAVLARYRRGLTSVLAGQMMQLPHEFRDPYVAMRTWSTNRSTTRIAERFGFQEVARIPDHRGPGVDTIYFARSTAEMYEPSSGAPEDSPANAGIHPGTQP